MKPQDHAYDDPELSAVGFLAAVMHDVALPLAIRIDAAAKLLPLYQKPQPIQTIKITGGLGKLTHEELVALEARAPGAALDWNAKQSEH